MFDCGPVYLANYESTADVVINQGGTDSGKTVAIIQLLTLIAATTQAPTSDPIITIVNKSVPDAKKGAYRTFKNLHAHNKYLQASIKDWNEGDRVITFHSGWTIEFLGAIDVQSAKQGKRQYLFVNEANGIEWEIFWQYAKRTRIRVFIDYNPSEPFWAHDKLIGTTKNGNDLNAVVQVIYSDHRHNPYLTARDHEKTENIRDPELHKVYARGKTGKLTGLIFPNWRMCTVEEFNNAKGRSIGGLDFGYTNDPTAASHMKVVRAPKNFKKITERGLVYVNELCYEPGISMPAVRELYRGCGFNDESPIYCDRDFESTRQLRNLKMMAIMTHKPPGSIKAGIHFLNSQWDVVYTDTSENITFERKRYMWDKDPISGRSLNEPIDAFNHHMDEIRAAIYTRYLKMVS